MGDGVWTDVTCAEAANQIRAAALGLISLGVQAGDRVVIFSATRYEWAILDFAILAVGAVTVPIYETSSAEQVRWVLQDSEAVVLFAETDSHATMVAELSGSVPALRERPPRVTLGHHQLRQPFEDDRQDQQVVHGPTT
ncbi:long-chain acyl-CoA synthetase [Mycobacterium tuberculosis]|nr:long-chain acyl-CoA synthetase [Mycobacterium tuberculosis]